MSSRLASRITRDLWLVDDGFDRVAVRIEDEGGVIVGTVLRPRSGSAVVPAAGCERGAMECGDRIARRRGEGEVEARARRARARCSHLDGELVIAARNPIADRRAVRPDTNVAERD